MQVALSLGCNSSKKPESSMLTTLELDTIELTKPTEGEVPSGKQVDCSCTVSFSKKLDEPIFVAFEAKRGDSVSESRVGKQQTENHNLQSNSHDYIFNGNLSKLKTPGIYKIRAICIITHKNGNNKKIISKPINLKVVK